MPLCLLALLAPGCSQDEKTSESGPPSNAPQAPQAISVGFLTLKPVVVERTNRLPGRVLAFEEAEIRPQVSGIVLERLFEEGSMVEEGQPLYQIDPAVYEADLELAEANLNMAEARLKNARLRFGRFEELIGRDVVSQEQFDDAEAELRQSEAAVNLAAAEVRRAEINLEYTKVRAPITGYIGPSAVTRGALLTARQTLPLATVRQIDPVYVDLSQTAAEARRLEERILRERSGGETSPEYRVRLFLTNDDVSYPHEGRLDATDLAVDPQTGSIRLRAVVPNPDRTLLPGLFVRASVEEVGETKALLVPQKSVLIEPDGSKAIWVVSAKKTASKRPIRTGASYEGYWIVRGGLEAGDQVIVEGRMNLKEGAPLKPEELPQADFAGNGSKMESGSSPEAQD